MPVIRPFKGLRYNPETVGDLRNVVAPPYDIIYDEWRERLYERNPYNIIRLIKEKEQPGDTEKTNKYTRARDYLNSWMSEGVLKPDSKSCMYVRSDTYTVNGAKKTRFGFIALLKIEAFGESIHAHERTLSAPKIDRINLVKTTETNLSQIFSIFHDPESEIENILLSVAKAEPEIDFEDEQGILRRLWPVEDMAVITKVQNLMKNRPVIIADGHHRYETALEYKNLMEPSRKNIDEPFDYVSMYFSNVDAHGMSILPTHRKVGRLKSFDTKKFIDSLRDEFDIIDNGSVTLDKILELTTEDSGKTNIFGIYTADSFYIARLRNPATPKELDVELLHDRIIEKRLGITRDDIVQGKYLHFCKSPEHAYDDVASGTDQVSFFMNPVTSEELFRVVLQGRRMPQKSTYFFPKTLSGLVMYRINADSLD